MKAFRIVMILSLLALSLAFTSTGANAAKFASYTSSIQLQNLDSVQEAVITLNFYQKDCADPCAPVQVNATISPNGQKFWFPLPNEVTEGFNGSVVVTSTTNVASISNVLGNDGAAAASYVADSQGNTTLTLPVLMQENSGYTSWFNVQNAGTTTANVEVTYSDGSPKVTASIKPGSAHTFDQAIGSETHTRKFFAGTVTSTNNVNLVATVIIENTALMQAYTGFKEGSPNPVMPLINVQPNIGIVTGVNLANTGTTATDVTVSYTPSPGYGAPCTEKQTIPAKDFRPFTLYVFSASPTPAGIESNCAKGSRFVGSAKVTANTAGNNLAVIVNQLQGSGAGSSYNGFDPATATSKFVAPLIMDRNSTKYRLYTSINLMNVGTVTTKVTCAFTGTGASQPWTSGDIAPNAGTFHIQANYFTTFPYVGGASCTASDPNAKIIAVINEAQANPTPSDQNMTYEAINVTP